MRRVGREVAGAWRSLQYDMARRPEPAPVDGTTDVLYPEYEATERPRRKLLAATAFGVLSLAGAAGTYFAVVNGLGALPTEEPAGQPNALPAVARSATPEPAEAPHQTVPSTTPQVGTTPTSTRKPSPRPAKPGPGGVVRPAPSPTCACVTPPVPRPTSPPPVVNTPDPTPTTPPQESPSPTPEPTTAPADPPPAG